MGSPILLREPGVLEDIKKVLGPIWTTGGLDVSVDDRLRDRGKELADQAKDSMERQHKRGKLSALERVEALLDAESFKEMAPYVEHRATALGMDRRRRLGDGVVTGHGSVDGRPVFVYSQDFGFMGGSLGEMHARKICHILDLADRSKKRFGQ